MEGHGNLEAEGDVRGVGVGAEEFVVGSDTMGLHTVACNHAGTVKGPSIDRRDNEIFNVHSIPAIPEQAFEVAFVVA